MTYKNANLPTIAIVATLIAVASFRDAQSQTTVNINNGQTLLIADLLNGSFQGSNFALAPTTTFEVNKGGRLGAIANTTPYGTLDFNGSTVDVNDGGIFGLCVNPDCGVVKNLKLNVYDGGSAFMALQTGSGTVANIYGGSLSNTILEAGSVVNIHGGSVGRSLLRARPGSELNISGSRFRDFDVQGGSQVTLFGGEFRLNGTAYSQPTISLNYGDVFSGTLSDGNVFIITPSSNLSYSNIRLDSVPLPPITVNHYVIDGTEQSVPNNLRAGQSLSLHDGGELDSLFYAQSASIEIQGGTVGQEMHVVESTVKISGGQLGNRFRAELGSTVTVTGGNFMSDALASEGSIWNIHGGSLGCCFSARGGSEVNVYGGNFGSLHALAGSTTNIHGGTLGGILAYGGITNLFVKSASVNGVPLDLGFGLPTEITERGFSSILKVVLSDGSPLSIRLAPDEGHPPSPFIHPNADLFVILVPEPGTFVFALFFGAVKCLGYRYGRELVAT